MKKEIVAPSIRAIVGLGNPGPKYYKTRHSIGFRVLDELALRLGESWQAKNDIESVRVTINESPVLLVKPQTFMNQSGQIITTLKRYGFSPEETLVVHDDIELAFGVIKLRKGGSHRGHNGLRSIIDAWGKDFYRLRFGVGRPENKDNVPDYVLRHFLEPTQEVEELISTAIEQIINLFSA